MALVFLKMTTKVISDFHSASCVELQNRKKTIVMKKPLLTLSIAERIMLHLNLQLQTSTCTRNFSKEDIVQLVSVRRQTQLVLCVLVWIYYLFTCDPSIIFYRGSQKDTWKHDGGGNKVMRCAAAGGTGNTPPGTEWRPTAKE